MPETVSILRVQRVPRPSSPGRSRDELAITYAVAGLTPGIVYLDPANDTPEERRRLIAEDVQERRGAKPDTVEID